MKTFLVALSIVSLLLVPLAVYTQPVTTVTVPSSAQNSSAPPPISQPLIREGDFAVKLVSVLKLGTANSGAEAENVLTSADVVPKNGWISDYPVTPVVIGQLQQSIEAAARAGKLPMNPRDATQAFQMLVANEGLPVQVALGSPSGEAATNYGEYSNASLINNYYYDEGPPVITYYLPPPDYFYLYTWVSYPFWWAGFWFPGYYCLNDFDVVLFVHHRREICTDHFFNPVTRRFFRIDPRTLAFERAVHDGHELALRHWREHAGAIYGQNSERFHGRNAAPLRGPTGRGLAPFSRAENHPLGRTGERGFQSLPNHSMITHGERAFHGSERSFGGLHAPSMAGRPEGFHSGFPPGLHGGFSHSMTAPGARASGAPGRSFGGFHSPSIAGRPEGFYGGFGGRSFGGFHGGGFHGGFAHGRG